MLFKSSILALMLTSAAAFSTMKPLVMIRPAIIASTTAHSVIMSDEETASILKKSEECAASECSLDEVDDLVVTLKDTQKELEVRLEKIMNMISHLQHINEKEERKTDEVREFVKDMLRVFNTDKPMVFPQGYAGDVGKGSQTAYDVLPPKKWTNPDKK
ncbi:hypothetical protein FRACYDRAFT_269481 [Fragilariopsis cylindrus CCMP1102]|uniref:Uncharacterized protein n=1 Tax=Fragilariopsis cylindrus CCMP1102 TaxID=635003 RepID=A0A1E7FC65_9STRA|nr:hypothetical protein FRACYDRAFT_269481 [Fragilariopsis cylindrus CCMP1102]|eukprot:OEU15772.1 hypothetical protein FRACYDRAFT_269481 [Fragilariopsis cylindrus CCMP1102]